MTQTNIFMGFLRMFDPVYLREKFALFGIPEGELVSDMSDNRVKWSSFLLLTTATPNNNRMLWSLRL